MKVLQGFMMFLGLLMGVLMDYLDFGSKLCYNCLFFRERDRKISHFQRKHLYRLAPVKTNLDDFWIC